MALPGVRTQIRDRFYALSRTNIPVTPTIAIIGMRTTADATQDGATGVQRQSCKNLDPYIARDEKLVEAAFGTGSDLHRGFKEALAGGAQRVILVPLPSDTQFDHATGSISATSYVVGDLWDDLWSAVESSQADIIVPWGRGAAPEDMEDPATPNTTPGVDGYPEFGFHADNSATAANSWVTKVATKVSEIIKNSHPCFAVMGIKPYIAADTVDGVMTPAQVSSHLALSNLVDRDASELVVTDIAENNVANIGAYVSVVCAELTPVGYNDTAKYGEEFGFSNGAAVYAGYVAQLDSWSAPTGKPIYNVAELRYNPTKTQQEAMINKGVVPVALNFRRAASWVDAQTFANSTSDFTRLTTLRIVFDAVQAVRQVSQSYIGEATTLEMRNAFETSISGVLMGMQQLGALLRSDYVVTYLAAENKAVVDLILWPAFELRSIDIRVAVQL